jgi:hypothetical protein
MCPTDEATEQPTRLRLFLGRMINGLQQRCELLVQPFDLGLVGALDSLGMLCVVEGVLA